MLDAPSGDDLLAEVERALKEGIAPGFAQRVTANAVALARRERAMQAPLDAAECERLTALIGEGGDLAALNAALCAAIRTRAIDAGSARLMTHLWETTRAKLAVDQPAYPPFRAEAQQ